LNPRVPPQRGLDRAGTVGHAAITNRFDPKPISEIHPGRVLFIASALHVCNDAFFAVLYPIMPFIAAELGLSYSEVGLVKTAFTGSSALLQLPAGLLAERWGEYALLAWGNGWVAAGMIGIAAAGGLPLLLLIVTLGGLGGNVQHPLASALVARAYPIGRRSTALGTLNFAGDLGKMATPALVGLAAVSVGWRATLLGLGLFGLAFSVLVGLARMWVGRLPTAGREVHRSVGTGGIPDGFWLLMAVGMLDTTTRGAALTFLPFVLNAHGFDTAQVSLVFGLLFAGGAVGKFVCGLLGDRFGPFAIVVATELITASALVSLLGSPLVLALGLAVVFGFALNGTSSVLYAAVATFVPEARRGRGYGLYYTGTQSASAIAPLAYGFVADQFGLNWTFFAMAALTAAVVPLAIPLRRRLAG
jgi:MFS transporter, FSR family, fosmidomycin resistance protein